MTTLVTFADRRAELDPPRRAVTLAEWDQIRDHDPEQRIELVKGDLLIVAPPKTNHSAIVSRLIVWLASHGYSPDVMHADAGLATSDITGRVPDLMVLREPVPNLTHVKAAQVLLVVEVVSPSTASTDRLVKPDEYAEAGVEHFWRVEGMDDLPTATVHRLRPFTAGAYGPAVITPLADLLTEAPPLD